MKLDVNLTRRKFEQSVAADVAEQLFCALGPGIPIEDRRETVCRVFGEGLDRHNISTEAAAARILHFIPAKLADINRRHDELQRRLDAAFNDRGRHLQPHLLEQT